MSNLVNGRPTKDFIVERGLRHCDPLWPFLFTFVVEGLADLLNKETNLEWFEGYKVNKDIEYILLQFADDTLILGRGCWHDLWSIKYVLRNF